MASDEPPEKDMKDFEFIQLCKFRVSQLTSEVSPNRSQLLASSSAYGLLFYAVDDEGFKVVKTSELLSIDQSKGKDRNKVTVSDFPLKAKVTLPSPVDFLAISSDDLTLAVVLRDAGHPNILFFDVRSFADKPTSVLPFAKSNPGISANVSVLDIIWNPAVGAMLAICLSDGSLQLLEVTVQAKLLVSLPASTGATCFSWSPKGKQLLVGKKDGSLAQYDHSLAEKKQWTCPTVFNAPQTVVDVVWLSTYSFLAGYMPIGAQASEQPTIVLTQSNKENNAKHINFDDPCFGNGEERQAQLLFHFVQKWEMVILASSRASEATIIGKNLDDKTSWEHWNLDDCSRAELPLTANQNDSYPLGLAVDYSPQNQVVLSETKTLPACPIMFILSSDRLLLSYHLSYTHKDATQVTVIPQTLDPAAARKGVPGLIGKSVQQPAAPAPAPVPTPTLSPVAAATAAPSPPVAAPAASLSTSSAQPSASQISSPSSMPFAGFSSPAMKPTFDFGGTAQTKPGDLFPSGQKPPPPFGGSPFQTSQPSGGAPSSTVSSFSFSMTGPAASKGQSSAFVSLSPASPSAPAQPAQGMSSLNFGQPSLPKPNLQQLSTFQAKPATVPDMGTTRPQQSEVQQSVAGVSPVTGIFGLGKKPDKVSLEGVKTEPQNANAIKAPSQFAFSSPTPGPRFQTPASSTVPVTQSLSTSTYVAAAIPGQPSMGAPPAYSIQQADRGMLSQAKETATASPGGMSHGEESRNAMKATLDIISQNITEEIADFERDMRDLISRTKQGVKAVGNRTEMQTLRQDSEKMSNFLTEIKETTKDQTKEVQDLKSTVYNILCTTEECNSLHQRNNDPHYHSVLKGRALDPVTAEKLKSLQQMAQSLESTVIDVDHVLDSHWHEHLNKEKEKMTTSSGDTIYKTIKNNHWLISGQRGRLEKLEEQIRSLKIQPKARVLDSGSPFNILPQAGQASARRESPSLKPAVIMTPEKVSKLRDYLLQRKVPVVKSTTPTDLSMSRIIAQSAKKSSPSVGISNTPSPANVKMVPQPQPSQQTPPQYQSTPQSRLLPGNMSQQSQQTPTGIPAAQLRLSKGAGLFSEPSILPAIQKPWVPINPGQPMPAGHVTLEGQFVQRGAGGGGLTQQTPTAFSGVAYFKQPQQPPPATNPGFFSGQQIPPDVQAAAQVLSTHMGGAIRQDGLLASIPQLLSAAAATGKPLNQQQLKMQNMYEDITPTETDETNDDDDDDDYDEEDNGYEDEDEDEEDAGVRIGYKQELPGSKATVSPAGIPSQSLGQGLQTAAPKNLFSNKFPSSNLAAGGDQGSIKALSPSTAEPKPDVKPPMFAPPKLGGGAPSFNFAFNANTSSAASTTTPSIFGGKPTASKPAFSFGGSGVLGQKSQNIPATTASTGTTSIFGSMATPSKSVGFGDLAPGSTKEEETKGPMSSTPIKAAITVSASPVPEDNKSPKDIPGAGVKGDTTTTPITSAPAFSITTSAPAPVASPASTGFSFGSTNTDPAKSGSSLFGTQAKVPPKSEEAVKTSPFASQPLQTGFSIFGGNKATSPSSSKGGFDAAFSATSPPAVTKATGFSFSPSANSGSSSGELFGSKSVVESTASPSTDATDQKLATVSGASTVSQAISDATTSPPVASTAAISPVTTSSEGTPNLFSNATPVKPAQDQTPSSSTTPTASQGVSSAGQTSSTAVSSTSAPPFSSFTFGSKGATTSTPSLFGSASPAASTAVSSTTTTTTAPLFGSVSQTTTPSTSGFNNLEVSSPQATPPVFGGQSATSTSGGLFGAPSLSAATTTTASVAGFGMTSTASTTPLFGGSTTGEPATSTSVSKSLFATTTTASAVSSAPSLFSGSSFSSKPLFGTSTPPSGSMFGGGGDAASTTTSSLFSSATSSSTIPSFGFGTSTQASGGPFQASNTSSMSSSGNLFSKPAGGLFSNPSFSESSPFGGASVSSANTNQTGSVFGQPPSTAGSLGFGQGQTVSSSLFGGEGFGLGGKPSEEKAKQNVFGSSSQTFGAENIESTSLFGSGGSSSFGTVGSGSSFSSVSGGFSSGGGRVASSGFGVSGSGTSPGFGSAPTFGGTPAFGSTGFNSAFGSNKPAFGSSPSFGSGASFGAAPSFGSAASPGPFGSASTGSDAGGGFGSFASASAPSFGQLAQSTPTNTFGSPQGGFGSGQTPTFGSGGQAGTGVGGGGFGSFSASPGFGQSASTTPFGSTQSPGFGNTGFGSSPAFSSYRG